MRTMLIALGLLTFQFFAIAQEKVIIIGKVEVIKAIGDSSIFIGANAGMNDFGNRLSTFVGNNAGKSNDGGLWNTFIGYNAGKNSIASGNTFIGRAAGLNSAGYSNLFLGNNTGRDNTGFENTMVGTQSGLFSSGNGHVFLGAFAGLYETDNNKLYIENSNSSSPLIYGEFDNDLVRINGTMEVEGNTKITGKLNIISSVGDSSIFIGANAGMNDSGNRLSTFVGNNAGKSNDAGLWNTFIGYNAGKNSSASGNTFVGRAAGLNSAGYSNLFLGNNTGRDNTGFENTMVGTQSGLFSSGNGHVFLGALAGLGETGNNKLYIENSNSSSPLIYGEFDNDLVRINGKLELSLDPVDPLDAATKNYVDLLETKVDALQTSLDCLSDWFITGLPPHVQKRLDLGETPIHIYNSGIIIDSLYGKTYDGGLIFYLNTTTGDGLIAAPSDQAGAAWGCKGTLVAGADGSIIGTGMQNTIDIANDACHIADGLVTAEEACTVLSLGGHNDWFLPSKDELNEMYVILHLNGHGSFSATWYYSSTESSHDFAENQNFSDGTIQIVEKDFVDNIRAVREF